MSLISRRRFRHAVPFFVGALLAGLVPFYVDASLVGTTERVSVSSAEVEGNNQSASGVGQISISGDGRFVVFTSYASNLAPGDINGTTDVFVRDRANGTTSLVSGGAVTDKFSNNSFGAISANGRYVVFSSIDASLDTSTPAAAMDTYLRDLVGQTTTRLSHAWDGGAANGVTTPAGISADGRYVLLNSSATNLTNEPDVNNDQSDVFILDRQTDTTTRVSLGPADNQGDLGMSGLSISDDGRYIGMGSNSTNFGVDNHVPCPIPPNCFSPYSLGYVRDQQTGVTTLITVDGSGTPANDGSGYPMLSGDGRFATYWSHATNLGALPNENSVLVSDLTDGTTVRVGAVSNIPTISRDGRFVAFDGDGAFVYDRVTGLSARVDVKDDGSLGNSTGFSVIVNEDGTAVAFGSYATDLVPGDTNGFFDVFVREPVPTNDATVPGAPTGVTAAAGDGTASIAWVAPASTGGSPITGYTVTASPGGSLTTAGAAATGATIGGLSNGTPYTFTVTASNAIGPSAPSDPSVAVTPQAGAPAPQTASETVPPGSSGSATTDPGSGPTAADPVTTSVNVPPTAAGGSVTVSETAVTETPPVGGYQFLGQQIDITSSVGTSNTNPLTIVFTVDETAIRTAFSLAPADPLPAASSVDITRAEGAGAPVVIPACASLGGGGSAIAPDPCVANRTYVNGGTDLQATVLTSTASHWNTAVKPVVVTVADGGYVPASVTVGQGGVVRWSYAGAKSHSVTDTQRLGPARSPLFDSGLKTIGKFGYAFAAAGAYPYGSTAQKDGKFSGTVQVPMTVQPANGGIATVFTVRWSSRSISGYVFDVEARFKKAGTNKWTAWSTWQNGLTSPGATSTPTLGAGTYAFHARLRQLATGSISGWSTDLTVLVQ